MRVKRITLIVIVLLLLGGSALAMSSANYALDWFVPLTGAGGGAVSSANYAADFTVGQVVIGAASSANYTAGLGYWHGVGTSANLSVSIVDLPDPVATGGTLTYTITIINNGQDDASGVVLTDTLPPDVIFGSASAGCGEAAGVVTCTLGNMDNGVSTAITIVVTAPGVPGTITNTATIEGEQSDPDTSNNIDTASTTVSRYHIFLPIILRNFSFR